MSMSYIEVKTMTNKYAYRNFGKTASKMYDKCTECNQTYNIRSMFEINLYLFNVGKTTGYICPHCKKKVEDRGVEIEVTRNPDLFTEVE